MKHESMPIPNWPRKSLRAIPNSSRFDEAPIVESSPAASSSVSPIPLSRHLRVRPSIVMVTRRGQSGSSALRASIASRPFWRSSRMYTRGPEYRFRERRSTIPLRSTWNVDIHFPSDVAFSSLVAVEERRSSRFAEIRSLRLTIITPARIKAIPAISTSVKRVPTRMNEKKVAEIG